MATMRVGHYPINNRTAEHAFAIMDFNGSEYRFQCYGGTWDNERVYPANYYENRNMWYTRESSITGYRELACHPYIAIHLAQWGNPLDLGRYDYDRKSGGDTKRGDCSGLTYALDGVCHQMCNTIVCATWPGAPLSALINWPPSLNSSKLIYGNLGSCGQENAIKDYVRALLAFYGPISSDGEMAAPRADASALDSELADIAERKRAAIRSALEHGPDAEERRMLVSSTAGGGIDMEPLLAADAETMALKRELDNTLVRGEVSNGEYAAQMNGAVRSLVDRYAEVMGEAAFSDAFGNAAADVECNVVDVELMLPDYTVVKEELGL